VEGGGGGLTVSGVSRNHGSFVKCVAIQKRLGIPGLYHDSSCLDCPSSQPVGTNVDIKIIGNRYRLFCY
jgi:hypothetical protein